MSGVWRLALTACLAGLSGVAAAQPQLSTNEVVYKNGNWSVVRSIRARSDTVGCTGFYRTERDVQLSAEQLIVKVSGELKQVVVRFGDELSLPPRPPNRIEKQMNAVVLSGEQFQKLQTSRKLSVEVTTKDHRKAVVMRLQGLPEALSHIKSGCPAPAQPASVSCSEPLRARMRANGVTPAQVSAICGG